MGRARAAGPRASGVKLETSLGRTGSGTSVVLAFVLALEGFRTEVIPRRIRFFSRRLLTSSQ